MPAGRELHTGRHNFLHRSWGPLEPFDDSMPQLLRDNGVHTHLASDHPHYWENGGATYHTRYTTWEFFRGQEGDPWKGVVTPGRPGSPAAAMRGQDEINRRYMPTEAEHSQTRTVDAGMHFLETNAAADGVTATEHELLTTPLKSEWGFDGVVVSDWTAVRSLASASAAQDLVMPGPQGPWATRSSPRSRRGTSRSPPWTKKCYASCDSPNESAHSTRCPATNALKDPFGTLNVPKGSFRASGSRGRWRADDLVRAVAATGTPTVVVVNAGSPVLLPWRDDVAALLVTYFGGQETGHALADVLLGRVEPGGRLPTTWPARTEDVPVLDVTPVDGRVHYDEDIHLGYRAWLKAGTEPAYPFGHGLGYTTWRLTDLDTTPEEVRLSVTNLGGRAGKQVVQVYLSRPESTVDRPVRWLAAHAVVRAAAGDTTRLTIPLPRRAFADWQAGGWHYEPGEFTVLVGTSATDLPLTGTVLLASSAMSDG